MRRNELLREQTYGLKTRSEPGKTQEGIFLRAIAFAWLDVCFEENT